MKEVFLKKCTGKYRGMFRLVYRDGSPVLGGGGVPTAPYSKRAAAHYAGCTVEQLEAATAEGSKYKL